MKNELLLTSFLMAGVALSQPAPLKECRSKIPGMLCLLKKGTLDTCVKANTQAMAIRIQKIYDFYPAPIRNVFCSLKKIYIDASSKAKGDAEVDSIGLNKNLFDHPTDLSIFLTNKERDALGLNSSKKACPKISAQIEDLKDESLAYTIAHEVGHILADQIHATGFHDGIDGQAPPMEGSFSALNWKAMGFDDDIPLPPDDFEGRKLFKYYSSEHKKITPQQISQAYKGLASSDFLTAYASENTEEDFAESFAIMTLASTQKFHFKILCPPETIDVVEKLKSDLFQKKADWLKQHLPDSNKERPAQLTKEEKILPAHPSSP